MAKVFGLDIPPGWEYTFSQILTLKLFRSTDTLMKRRSSVSQAKKKQIVGYSLFLLWQDLWSSFLAPRRDAWQAYWATLPFGAHSGENGWPGSGYSAFVYVNAPRYAAGLDLLLDPPNLYGPELLASPNFEDEADWLLDENAEWSVGAITVQPDGNEYFGIAYQTFAEGLENGMYHIELNVTIPTGVVGYLTPSWWEAEPAILIGAISTEGSGDYIGIGANTGGITNFTFSGDVEYNNDPTTNGFWLQIAGYEGTEPIIIHRASLRAHLV